LHSKTDKVASLDYYTISKKLKITEASELIQKADKHKKSSKKLSYRKDSAQCASLPGGTGKRRLQLGAHALTSACPDMDYPTINLNPR